MAPTIQSDNELSSEFHVVAIIVFVAFAIVCGLSIVVVLIMCCDDEKKKKKEATPRSVKSKSTRFEAERKFVAIAEKPKEDIEQRNVKLKKDVSFRAKDSSQISRMGSFQMQSNQLQEKKGGRSQSFAKGKFLRNDIIIVYLILFILSFRSSRRLRRFQNRTAVTTSYDHKGCRREKTSKKPHNEECRREKICQTVNAEKRRKKRKESQQKHQRTKERQKR